PEEAKKSEVLKGWDNWNSKVFPGYMTTNNWIDNLYSALPEGNALSAYSILRKEFEQSGLKAMLAAYNSFSEPDKTKYYFIETDINNWGYALMAENKFADAIEVLKINTDKFPGSANAFDSLGEAYMKAGHKELAIKHYEKSLQLNPQNTNALEQLKNLKMN
ncbi:MAG: tetratricopeptide repeat protein, partial [Bacteroidia bacterium]|nr:tetratricopeptide repeat protein [Bacteroidia bacterium]